MTQSLETLDELFTAFEHLREVLGDNDPVAIDAAGSRIGDAVAAIRAVGAWRSDPALIERVNAMLPLLDSARIRLNLLTDHANQKLAILAAHGSAHAPLTYGR
ncbi:MAG: hypothetical protein I8H86_00755 [Sphingomonadaceae bacterium]|nr:hypothetical protein [Sphingomonadaceae bacterium]